jgi:8-oxo-dGTP pyrophosphatase MutT (NUDIX family)
VSKNWEKTVNNMIGEHDTSKDSKYWGTLASGVLPIAKSTCRVLLQKRSSNVNWGGTWGIVGGAVEVDGHTTNSDDFYILSKPKNASKKMELLEQTAKKELWEETGYNREIELEPMTVFKDPEFPFEYHSFIGSVPDEFKVIPNEKEQDASIWICCILRNGCRGKNYIPRLRVPYPAGM